MEENNYYQDHTEARNNSVSQNNYYQDYTANMPYQAPMPEGPEEYTNGLQITSLVLGIASILVCCCWGAGFIFAIPGLICAIIGNNRSKSGIGIAGLICSIVGIILNAVTLFLIIWGVIISVG